MVKIGGRRDSCLSLGGNCRAGSLMWESPAPDFDSSGNSSTSLIGLRRLVFLDLRLQLVIGTQ